MRTWVRRAVVTSGLFLSVIALGATHASAALNIKPGGATCSPIVWGVRVAYKVCQTSAATNTIKLHIYNRQPQNADSVLVYLARRSHSDDSTRFSPVTKYSWGSTFTVPAGQNLTITRTYTPQHSVAEVEAMVDDRSTGFLDRPFVYQSCYLEACGGSYDTPREYWDYQSYPFF